MLEVLLALDKEESDGLGELEVVMDAHEASFELGPGLVDGLETGKGGCWLWLMRPLGIGHHLVAVKIPLFVDVEVE